ncbi:MAG: LuxE/PaaK family acyltransferase [Promethearchaeota archaeon]
MFLKFHDHLTEELKTKYFDFKNRDYQDDEFCKEMLKQINLSYNNCKYYKDNLCSKFDFTIPDEITIDNLENIPYIPTGTYKKSGNRTLNLLKLPLENIALFSCSSSTTGDPSIVPRTLEDFDQLQYNSIKVFTEFFGWEKLKIGSKKPLTINFSPNRFFMSLMARRSAKGFECIDKTRYFTACMNKPWEYFGHEEYLVKMKILKTFWALISTFSLKGGFILDVTKMLKIVKKINDTGHWKNIDVSKILFGGSPLLMNNMFEKRLLKENIFIDLDGKSVVGCGGGGWDGIKGEAKMGKVNKTKFIESYEKVFNIKSKDIRDIYAFTEGPTLFGGHWSEKYQDFLLHCPDTARIIVRDLENLEPVNDGEEGLLEVLTPYGVNGTINQAVLVDDIVEVISNNKCPECGYKGATFRIIGRLKNSQGKSCSSLIDWIY